MYVFMCVCERVSNIYMSNKTIKSNQSTIIHLLFKNLKGKIENRKQKKHIFFLTITTMEDKIADIILKYPTKENAKELIKALRSDPKILSSANATARNLRPGVWKYLLLLASSSKYANPSTSTPTTTGNSTSTSTSISTAQGHPGGNVEFVNLATDEGTEDIHEACQSCELIKALQPEKASVLCERLEAVTRVMRGGVRGGGSLMSQRLASLPYARSHSDVVAPFVCLGMSESDAAACALAVLEVYAPFAAAQDPAFAERALCELIRLLLYYQDPALGLFVEQRGAALYPLIARWFRGLFSASAPGDLLLRLWDYIFILRDPAFFVFLCLAVLLEARDAILACKTHDQLDTLLAAFRFGSEAALDRAVNRAFRLTRTAPLSVRKQVLGVVTRGENARAWVRANIIGAPCIHTSILDLLQDKRAGRIVFVVDCRSDQEIARGTLPTAYPLPATTLTEAPQRFADALAAIKALRDSTHDIHFALCGTAGSGAAQPGSAELTALVYKLLREAIPHVSLVQNGFAGVHAYALEGKLELCDHSQDTCPICLANRSIFAKGLASLRDTAYQTLSMLSPSIEAAREKAALAVSQTMAAIEERAKTALTASAATTTLAQQEDSHAHESPSVPSSSAAATAGPEAQAQAIVEETKVPLPNPSTEEGMFTIEGDDDDDDDDAADDDSDKKEKSAQSEANTTVETKKDEKPEENGKGENKNKDKGEGENEDEDEDSISFGGNEDDFGGLSPKDKEKETGKDNELAEQGYATVHTWMARYSSMWEITLLKADGSENTAGFVAVADGAIIFLEKHPQHPTHARVRKSYPLTSIDKITTRKTNPKHNILRFKDHNIQPEQFLINDSQELIKAVKQALIQN